MKNVRLFCSYSVYFLVKIAPICPVIYNFDIEGMVLLKFTVQMTADLEEVWAYFSDFANIPQWDPNAKSVSLIEQKKGRIGSTYNLVSIVNGKESHLAYEVK